MLSNLSLRNGLISTGLVYLAMHAPLTAKTSDGLDVGNSIYLQGKGSKPTTAYLAGPGIEVASDGFACVKCHREDGSGSREGGVDAPDIRYRHLNRSLTSKRSTGRIHPAYDETSLIRAIREGVDPAGNPLHPIMPRYRFTDVELQSLIEYLKRLDTPQIPGVTEDKIRIGTLQPASGVLLQMSLDVRQSLQGFFKNINEHGGIYGRRLELVTVEYEPSRVESQIFAVESLTTGEGVFCTLSNLGLYDESVAVTKLNILGVPELAPLRSSTGGTEGLVDSIFYLYASLAEQGSMLADYVLSDRSDKT